MSFHSKFEYILAEYVQFPYLSSKCYDFHLNYKIKIGLAFGVIEAEKFFEMVFERDEWQFAE